MTSLHREPKANKRSIRRALAAGNVAEAVGPITPGCEIYGLCKGQFSLIDLIVYCLQATGPADLVVSTWTAAGSDIQHAFRLLTEGTVRTLRFLVDFSFPSRQPAYCEALRERFGDEAIRITKNHAKFVLIQNESWNLVVKSSMNLNENRRLENFEISDDRNMADYLAGVITDLFDSQLPGEGFTKKPGQIMNDFEQFAEPNRQEAHEAAARSTDSRKYFNPGAYQNDLNRTGFTRGR